MDKLPDPPIYVSLTGPEAIAAWLDRDNAKKLHVSTIRALRDEIDYLRSSRKWFALAGWSAGVLVGAACQRWLFPWLDTFLR